MKNDFENKNFAERHGLVVSFFTFKRIKKMPVWIDTNEMRCPSKSTAMTAQLKKIIVLLLEKPEYIVQDNQDQYVEFN